MNWQCSLGKENITGIMYDGAVESA